MADISTKSARFRPCKVKITKAVFEDLKKLESKQGLETDCISLILKQVEDYQTAPAQEAPDGMRFKECIELFQNLGVRDKVIIPDHPKAGISIGRFVTQLAQLQITAEDVERMSESMMRWKTPMALEKLTAILPSMLTEARSLKQKPVGWKPPTWDIVDGTSDF